MNAEHPREPTSIARIALVKERRVVRGRPPVFHVFAEMYARVTAAARRTEARRTPRGRA